MNTSQTEREQANKKLALKLVWVVMGAILFAFALVPLYDAICAVTGLNGKTDNSAATLAKAKVDNSRVVTVQFVSTVMPGLAWSFHPKQNSITVHPGEITSVLFEAKNTMTQAVTGQAIPSVTPGKASAHLKKIECFCFENQTLQAGESKIMPLRFFVSPDLHEDVKEMTLSYSFFKAPEQD